VAAVVNQLVFHSEPSTNTAFKKHIFEHVIFTISSRLIMTSTFHPLTSKSNQFIFVPDCL